MALAEGQTTLQQFRGYSDESLMAVARQAITLFMQGKVAPARLILRGLCAVNPKDAYFARLLGVAECASGDLDWALASFDEAIRLAPEDPSGYVGRAEVFVAMRRRAQARDDLTRAVALSGDPRMTAKAHAMLVALSPR